MKYYMIQSLQLPGELKCEKHRKPLNTICTAPECFHYRQLCQDCKKQDSHHSKMHFLRSQAYQTVHETIDNVFKGLKTLRTKIIQKMDTSMNSHEGLKEISTKLEQIKSMLNHKIDNFRQQLCKLYETNIKRKLSNLFLIVQKSYEFLEQERLKLIKTEKLKPFLINDLSHELRYYQSYYDQILEKDIRKFKTGFEHDKVMKLVISFEQNLTKIFNFSDVIEHGLKKPHVLYSDCKYNYLISLKDHGSPVKQDISFIPDNYSWVGIIPSVYYSFNDNYYIFGEGKKESNRICRINISYQEFKLLDIRLATKRSNFSVITLNDQIYIIGGQNSRQGCLVKCQKFVPNEGKTYIVSSLHQRSAQHSLCTYKNKYILKFGGTDLMQAILENHSDQRFKALHPQIYCIEKQEWRIIQMAQNFLPSPRSPINFGLWPAVFEYEADNKIVIFEGDLLKLRPLRNRFTINLPDVEKDQQKYSNEILDDFIGDMKIEIGTIQIPFNVEINFHSNCHVKTESGNIKFLVQDIKHRFSSVNFVI